MWQELDGLVMMGDGFEVRAQYSIRHWNDRASAHGENEMLGLARAAFRALPETGVLCEPGSYAIFGITTPEGQRCLRIYYHEFAEYELTRN